MGGNISNENPNKPETQRTANTPSNQMTMVNEQPPRRRSPNSHQRTSITNTNNDEQPPQGSSTPMTNKQPQLRWRYPPIKATTYSNYRSLNSNRVKQSQVNVLDFTGFVEKWSIEALN